MSDKKKPGIETICVHEGDTLGNAFNAVTQPIYMTSTFAFEAPGQTKGFDYSRTANPTRSALESTLAALEGGAGASATTTGMAAETTVMCIFDSGAHVIAGNDIYGGSYRLFASVLPERGLSFSFVNQRNLDEVRKAIRPETKAIWIETPSNPLLNIVDIQAICNLAKEHGLTTIVDNTFMTPYFQRPFELGADIVVHSTTKYLNGHCDVVGGAIISKTPEMAEKVAGMTNALGTCCSPFDAFLVLRGTRTLPCRMRDHARNAQALAEFLAGRDEVERVYFPGLPDHPEHELAKKQMSGFGGMLSFDIKGGEEAAFKFVEPLTLFAFAESLGGVGSLIEHPASMSHASMDPEARVEAGIKDSNIRVSVGIEDIDDLIAEMELGFANVKAATV